MPSKSLTSKMANEAVQIVQVVLVTAAFTAARREVRAVHVRLQIETCQWEFHSIVQFATGIVVKNKSRKKRTNENWTLTAILENADKSIPLEINNEVGRSLANGQRFTGALALLALGTKPRIPFIERFTGQGTKSY